MKTIIRVLGGLLIFELSSIACCMLPATYEGTIGQSAQEALVIHADGRQELVLRINYHVEAEKSGGELPPYFAWIITVPNEPDHYALADEKLFKDLFAWGNSKVVPQPRQNSKGATLQADIIPEGVELGERVEVGPYDIQPVRATGMHALNGLNDWLKANGFPQEDADHMRYFVENGFTFLCVKVTPPAGGDAVGSSGMLKPLQISFATPAPYYPLKFSSRQGMFELNVWLLTKNKIDLEKSSGVYHNVGAVRPEKLDGVFHRSGFNDNVAVKKSAMPDSLKTVLNESQETAVSEVNDWNLSVLRSPALNQRTKIKDWKSDVFFILAAE